MADSTCKCDKTVASPINVIVAYDTRFYEHLPRLTASASAKAIYEKMPELIAPTILTARAVGLDVGPMSGFNADKVDETFFSGGRYKVNFLAYLFEFDEVAPIV